MSVCGVVTLCVFSMLLCPVLRGPLSVVCVDVSVYVLSVGYMFFGVCILMLMCLIVFMLFVLVYDHVHCDVCFLCVCVCLCCCIVSGYGLCVLSLYM